MRLQAVIAKMFSTNLNSGISFLPGLLLRELRLGARHKGEHLQAMLFFILVISLFPLVLKSDPAILAPIAAGIIWVSALLASLLCLDSLFKRDWMEGTLEQMLLLGEPLYLVILLKVLVHWLMSSLPLILLGPWLGLMLHLPEEAFAFLFFSLLLGTPVLSLIGAIGAALVVTVRHSGLLVALLVLPLYVPVLLLAVYMVESAAFGQPSLGALLWLASLLTATLMLAPFAIVGGLKAVYLAS